MPVPKFGVTVQQPSALATSSSTAAIASSMSNFFSMTILGSLTKCPRWWSMNRDDWMVNFVKREGNDLLAGAVATVTAKIVANSWYIEGPALLAVLYRRLLLVESDFGRGWGSLASKTVEAYLNRDAGGTIELARSSSTDLTGPAMGFHHIDESLMVPTGDPEYPFEFLAPKGPIKMHRAQMLHIVDMPSGKNVDRGIGFCSVSRALTTAHILLDVVRYKRERLSDLLPAGLLLINNLGKQAWTDINDQYDSRQHNQGNKVWRDVMVALGVDPAYPITAEFFEFSQLPEQYEEKTATEVAVYSFALAFREDPREFWPVSSGPLGTATEAELQARSARIKGEGIIATALERELNRPEALPEDVNFHFDYQDDEADKIAAEIAELKSKTIRRLWEPSKTMSEEAIGIITTEQAQNWLVRERVIPWDVVGQPMAVERLYDTKGVCSPEEPWGPRVRIYRDGRCFKWAG